jgi:hypothetical protein
MVTEGIAETFPDLAWLAITVPRPAGGPARRSGDGFGTRGLSGPT